MEWIFYNDGSQSSEKAPKVGEPEEFGVAGHGWTPSSQSGAAPTCWEAGWGGPWQSVCLRN